MLQSMMQICSANLKKVLDPACEIKLRLNPLKCKFCLDQICNLGHVFTRAGLKADPTKTEAITKMPVPDDVPATQQFLCMVNYLGKFIPKQLAAPLRQLTHKDTTWSWLPRQKQVLDHLKSCLSSPLVLSYYDVTKLVRLTCAASE